MISFHCSGSKDEKKDGSVAQIKELTKSYDDDSALWVSKFYTFI